MVAQLLNVAPDSLIVMAGNERVALGLLALGAQGLISGLATAVPEPFVMLTQALADNDLPLAHQAQECINQLLNVIPPHTRLGSIKAILHERGVPVGPPVPPRPAQTTPLWPTMAEILGQ